MARRLTSASTPTVTATGAAATTAHRRILPRSFFSTVATPAPATPTPTSSTSTSIAPPSPALPDQPSSHLDDSPPDGSSLDRDKEKAFEERRLPTTLSNQPAPSFHFNGSVYYVSKEENFAKAVLMLQEASKPILPEEDRRKRLKKSEELGADPEKGAAEEPIMAAELNGKKVLGFDIEWKPSFVSGKPQNKVATIQLSHGGQCFVFHVARLKRIPKPLKEVLEGEDYIKVGVNIRGDILKMFRDYKVKMNGFLDLVDFGKAKLGSGCPGSLSGLVYRMMTKTLEKKRSVILSNWEAPLSKPQLQYAANDAAAGHDLYVMIHDFKLPKGTAPVPPDQFVVNFSDQYPALAKSEEKEPEEEKKEPEVPLIPLVVLEIAELYKEKTPQEIAELRGQKLPTVEAHIISGIHFGIITDLARFGITEAMMSEIGDLAKKFDKEEKFLTKLKESNQQGATFAQIRAILARKRWLTKEALKGGIKGVDFPLKEARQEAQQAPQEGQGAQEEEHELDIPEEHEESLQISPDTDTDTPVPEPKSLDQAIAKEGRAADTE